MQIFSCSECAQVLFFESFVCTSCGRVLAYLPDRGVVSALAAIDVPDAPAGGLHQALTPLAGGTRYRLCRNNVEHAVCNWAVPIDEGSEYCRACRLNHVIPNLAQPGAVDAWRRLETAKRRLVYSLLELGLPVEPRDQHPRGLAFSFLSDGADEKVSTGHSQGEITINVAEADDPFREKMRVQLGETYRTLLGHFRHEIGHYYWERLVNDTPWHAKFRALFGDETADYGEAQRRHYGQGPTPGWQNDFVSAYASMHPWEDFAETWAHYLHMVDTLDTARAYGLSLRATPVEGGTTPVKVRARRIDLQSFEELLEGWIPLTLALNSLNRSMGVADSYPFVLSQPAITKLRFVHELIVATAEGGAQLAPPAHARAAS